MDPRFNLAVWLLALAVVGCQTRSTVAEPDGLVARLRPVGSTVVGTVSAVNRGDGVALMAEVNNLHPGSYRLAFHQKAPCNTPDARSAGPPWAPPGATKPPATFLPTFFVNHSSNHVLTLYVSGVRVDGPDGLRGRTIIIHSGEDIAVPFPGQANSRIACGIFDYAKPLF